MCLNRQCQNVSVFGVHECSAKCSGRGVSTAPFIIFPSYDSCLSQTSPALRLVVFLTRHSSFTQKLILAVICSKCPGIRLVGSHYNASQSIILDAERFNQLDIIASFMLSFKCHSSYSEAVVLVPKTVLKSEGQALFGQALEAMTRSLTLSCVTWILDFSKMPPIRSLRVVLALWYYP